MTDSQVQLSAEDVDRLAALELATHLHAGHPLPVIDSSINLVEGEFLHYELPYSAYVFCGADAAYSKTWVASFGGPMALGATLGGSALYNRRQKKKAQDRAAPQWRFVETGVLHITNGRFGMAGQMGWKDVWYDYIRKTEVYPDGLVMYLDGADPIKIGGIGPLWLYAVYTWLVRGQVVQIPLDAAFVSRLQRVGRSLPAGRSAGALPPGT